MNLCKGLQNLNFESNIASFWEWDIKSDVFKNSGYSNNLSPTFSEEDFGTFFDFINQIYIKDRRKILKLFYYKLKNTNCFIFKFRLIHPDGKLIPVCNHARVIVNEQGLPVKIFGVMTLIHHKKIHPSPLKKHLGSIYLKRQSLSEMISHFTHELNQPLMVISTYIGGCVRRLDRKKDENKQIISTMNKVTHYAEILGKKIHHMKNFIRHHSLKYESSNIHDIINEVISLLSYQLQYYRIKVILNFYDNGVQLKIDRIQIKKVFLILLQHTIETISKNKISRYRLEVKTENITDTSIQISIKEIDNDTQNQIFFSSAYEKDKFRLGLIICRKIIKDHGGKLFVNLLNRESLFQFTLYNR